ncbi:hypothetical protein [Burkholderia cepacia]|uniref:hypothetical protein n=1 Tax=Burkholderia cepacia TaxID=292 RepID=UPI001CF3B1D2|nr:hypothetical protein [Burkholderia cepacia]MCA8326129.1 hypothetical protein [Burkholderia cepacia]
MSTTVTISTPVANRKEIAEAFGQNQSAVRRIEAMTRDITVNLPDAVDGASEIAQQALALAEALQQVAYVLASPSTEVPNASVIHAGTGLSINILGDVLTIALSVPVTVENGGTGLQSLTAHAVPLGNGTQSLNFAAPGTAAQVLTSNGAAADPSFQALPVSSIMGGTGITVANTGGSYTVTLQTPVAVTNGGTGARTAVGARGNLGAAASGANSDITSLSGLTTALSVAQGGTGANTLGAHGVLVGGGGSAVTALGVGSTGQVLTSNGLGNDPSMQAIPNQPGKLLNVQTLSATATYNKTAGTLSQIVILQAPGGSGGGVPATGGAQSAAAAGGGAGSLAEVYFPVAVTGVTVTLPTGPAGASAGSNNGTAGSTATFGGYISCPGGAAGGAGSTASSASITGASGRSSAPSVSTVGSITPVALRLVPGSSGGVGMVLNPGNSSMGGHGGQSPLYPAPYQDKAGSGAGINAGVPGEGGGGANEASASSAAQAGGTGGNACCIVFEFG